MSDFSDFLDALNPNEFDETPVDSETFLYDERYMGKYLKGSRLSPVQFDIFEHGTQIYKHETLINLHGEEEGNRLWDLTVKNILMMLGKGCHAPYTPVYNAENGRWVELDTLKDSTSGYAVGLTGGAEYRTESFYEGTGEMLRITTQLGLVEDVYIGHKYWGMTKNKFYKRNERNYHPEDIRADKLKVGDRIMVGLNMPVLNEISIGKDKAWVLGMLLGDGHMPGQQYAEKRKNNKLSIDFGAEEKDSLSRYLSIVHSWGDAPAVIYHAEKKMVTVVHHAKNSPVIFAFIQENNMRGKNAQTKDIPDVVWSLPREELYEFISGMFQTDGTIYLKKCRSGTQSLWTAEWCSISKNMAYGLQKLMLRAGIPASIRSKIPHYTYKGEYKTSKTAYILTVSGQDKLTEFNSKIVLTDYKQDRQQLAREFKAAKADSSNYMRIDGNQYADKVKKIETIPDSEYWTFTVPKTGHYVGNGLLSSNSGKDFTSRLMVLYVVYKILCLKQPQQYYDLASTDPIDIVNLALNSDQARTVFFEPLVSALKTSPWFAGKYKALARDVEFDKQVNLYSLHSDPENAEGKNVIVAILDEIDGFTVEGQAASIHKYLSGGVTSRFPGLGKVISLSFPRTKDGFIMSLYKDVVDEVDTTEYTHEFLVNNKLDRDAPGNLFTVKWTEDRILTYRRDNYYALKAPTFRVNPNRKIEDYKDDFETDRQNNDTDTLMRVCANPPDHDSTSFFTNHELIEETFSVPNGWDRDTIKVKSAEDAEYFIHVDLSKVSDRTVVAMGHVSEWLAPDPHARVHQDPQPFITIDLFRVWEPTRLNPVDDAEVMSFIVSLTKKFPVGAVTFDQWQSFDNITYLESIGVESEKMSLRREEYMEFRTAMYERRMMGPYDEKLHKELKNLILVKTGNGGKVDHPQGKEHFNDISEACCGVVVNCIRRSTMNKELKMFTVGDLKGLYGDQADDMMESRRPMPTDLQIWMNNDDGWEVI